MNETRRSTAVRWFGQATSSLNTAHQSGIWLLRLVSPLAQPVRAGVVALLVYGLRAAISRGGLHHTDSAYFNYLADAFLHGQAYLRLIPDNIIDLVHYRGNLYCYWPPFPAIISLPFVAIWGVTVSDVLLTVVLGALAIALFAWFLATLDATGIAPLSVERRGILVVTVAFGTVLL